MADDDVDERAPTIGDELIRLRTRAGLTQQALADAVGVSRTYITMIENGNRPVISSPVVFALSDALGVAVEHWRPYMGGQPPEPPPPPSRGKLK